MVDIVSLYERLARAVMLESEDAAIRVLAEYEPQAGPMAKVFPPTYWDGQRADSSSKRPTYLEREGTRYHFEKRWREDGNGAEVVVLDSYQSQANRCEAALARVARELRIPRLLLRHEVNGMLVEISSLEAPHRSRDAYFLDSRVNGKKFDETEVGSALDSATLADLSAYLRYAPTDLVYGVWDSHRGKRIALKFARSYTSEMLGWEPERGKRAATKGDPLNLRAKDDVTTSEWRDVGTSDKSKKDKLTLRELGHGIVPSEPDPTNGGVSVRSITRLGVLSLTGLARHEFGGDEGKTRAGRAALAALGLLGDRLAFGLAGIHLRSGCDLVLKQEAMEWVSRGGRTEPLELAKDEARQLLEHARERLRDAGVEWSGEPVEMEPSAGLKKAIEGVLTARGIGEAED